MRDEFQERVRVRQAAIDAEQINTGKLQKYTALAFECERQRVFRKTPDGWQIVSPVEGPVTTTGAIGGKAYVVGPLPMTPATQERVMQGQLNVVFNTRAGLNGPAHGLYYCVITDPEKSDEVVEQLISEDDLWDL